MHLKGLRIATKGLFHVPPGDPTRVSYIRCLPTRFTRSEGVEDVPPKQHRTNAKSRVHLRNRLADKKTTHFFT